MENEPEMSVLECCHVYGGVGAASLAGYIMRPLITGRMRAGWFRECCQCRV